MLPETDRNRILTAQKETTEAAALVSKGGQPLPGLHDISEILSLAQIGGVIPVSYTHLDVYKRQAFLV